MNKVIKGDKKMEKKDIISVPLGVEDLAYVEFARSLVGLKRSPFIRVGAVAHAIITIREKEKLNEFAEFLKDFKEKRDGANKNVEVKEDEEEHTGDVEGLGLLVNDDGEQLDHKEGGA